jgi:hypothetical protein
VSGPAEAHLLPPPPAAVAAYFQRRRSSIAGFSPEDLDANERLWREICGLPESAEPAEPQPAAAEAENEGSKAAEASPVVQSSDPSSCAPCGGCGQTFEPRREWSRYCSASCKQRAKRARRGSVGHGEFARVL